MKEVIANYFREIKKIMKPCNYVLQSLIICFGKWRFTKFRNRRGTYMVKFTFLTDLSRAYVEDGYIYSESRGKETKIFM